MTEEWLDDIAERTDVQYAGTLIPIDPYPAKSLPHWRVLTFECGGMKLDLYPNGGIINEWNFDFERQRRLGAGFVSYDNITASTKVYIKRTKYIMYDIELNNY